MCSSGPSTLAAAALAVLGFGSTVTARQQNVYVTLVHVRFTVTDPQGRPIVTLGRPDVAVYDNDVPQKIADFGRLAGAPVRLAVLIDRSQSVVDRFPLLVSTATAFEQSVLRGRDDRGLAVAFDSKVYLLQDWTHDTATLAASLRSLTAAGGTSLFDALYKTCRDKFEITDTQRNALVLVTDGEDTTSVATFDQALQMATISRVTVYVVGVRAEHSLSTREMQGGRVLARLSELTGGRLFYPDESSTGLDRLFSRVEAELNSAYSVSYYLDAAGDDSFHRIRVEPLDRTLAAHAPSGYYARRPSGGQ
jgi:VWFA-related protein